MTINRLILTFLSLACTISLFAQRDFYQDYPFDQADTLRGMLRPERTCYDVTYYDMSIRVDIPQKAISGFVDIYYTALSDFEVLQIDLFENMRLDKIEWSGKKLTYKRVHNAVFVQFPKQKAGSKGYFSVHYQGKPTEARNAPWDGGFVWSEDRRGRNWIPVACEGTGASLWWPNKDHLIDEPDRWRAYLINSIIEPVISKDILTLASVRKPALFSQCFDILASYPSQEISYRKLLGQLQDSGNTDLIKYYIELYQGAFLYQKTSD